MLLETLERVRPVCPACRGTGAAGPERVAPLRRDETVVVESGEVLQGTLRCTSSTCGERFPIIDGVPILVPEPVRYLEAYRHEVIERRDLLPEVQDFVDRSYNFADNTLAGKRYLSQYAAAHYAMEGGEQSQPDRPNQPNQMDELVRASAEGGGLVVDLGCATGRWTLVAAERADFALGMDLDFAMVRAAREMRVAGAFGYSRWEGGRRFGHGEIARAELRGRPADFFVADALHPPIAPGSADVLLVLNLTDNVPAPDVLLAEMGALLKPGGRFLHSTPYRWSSVVTPPEKQLDPGGLRAALEAAGLAVEGAARSVSWRLPGAPGEVTELTVEVLSGARR
jgi:SAM-dependent methyltransferase/uncharacterized protein YbaR (Trm112 family)